MNLLKQPNKWSCGPTSLAMLLSVPIDEIIRLIGHDGSEIMFPDEPEPVNHKSFHVQELIDVAFQYYDIALLEIVRQPGISTERYSEGIDVFTNFEGRFNYYLRKGDGLILGQNNCAQGHMCAWINEIVYDPKNPKMYTLGNGGDDELMIESFFLKIKIK